MPAHCAPVMILLIERDFSKKKKVYVHSSKLKLVDKPFAVKKADS